jgi:hypothetical protein
MDVIIISTVIIIILLLLLLLPLLLLLLLVELAYGAMHSTDHSRDGLVRSQSLNGRSEPLKMVSV